MFIYIVALIAISVMAFVLIIRRFYTNLFISEQQIFKKQQQVNQQYRKGELGMDCSVQNSWAGNHPAACSDPQPYF